MKDMASVIYRGIENVEVDGVAKDYIKIEYGRWRKPVYFGDKSGHDPEICG